MGARKWQNAKHSSRSPWVQVLKDCMKDHVSASKTPEEEVDLDAETEQLGGSEDELGGSSDTDCIPDNFFGVPDQPPHDSEASSSDSETWLKDWALTDLIIVL